MSRKGANDLTQVLQNLFTKNLLKDWQLIDIQELNPKEVSQIMKKSKVYLLVELERVLACLQLRQWLVDA